MTCDEASERLSAFVDAELPGPELLEVARHAAQCPACERAIRDTIVVQQVLVREQHAALAELDLMQVWPRVAAEIDRLDAGAARPARRARMSRVPMWGAAALAMAAGALFWFRSETPAPTRLAARARPNQAVIERIDSDGTRFELRRERKLGTTLIMVSALDQGVLP